MALRKGHGAGANHPLRIEVLPPDEIPDPVPAKAAPIARTPTGRIADSASAKALGARGGLARHQKLKFISSLGLSTLPDEAAFSPYLKRAEDFMKAKLLELANEAGGYVGAGPSSLVGTAARQLAASIYFFDVASRMSDNLREQANLFHRSSTLGNDSRQNLLAAYSLAVEECKTRKALQAADLDPFLEAATAPPDEDTE